MSFVVMGFPVTEVEQNAPGVSEEQQKAQPPERELYETDDESEAAHIVNAGGYVDSENVWQVATRYVEKVSGGDVLAKGATTGPLRKPAGGAPLAEAALPDNSAATVDPTGRVHSDDTTKPLKYNPGDVEAMAQADLEIPIRKTIIDHDGNLGNLGKDARPGQQ